MKNERCERCCGIGHVGNGELILSCPVCHGSGLPVAEESRVEREAEKSVDGLLERLKKLERWRETHDRMARVRAAKKTKNMKKEEKHCGDDSRH